ncbi:uncharacterized protein LOC127861416 isoform X2 [Dreissena polymorpha]|uniref:uncharacterized protein LOC127861416 isoform X2 n=1 Tax=Dreissena polymorpha TaxID=45954 RepID=UPI002264B9CF|nr:uncharacterized protein LOC127861416 isoform X2 [Dreissena polymorpha]
MGLTLLFLLALVAGSQAGPIQDIVISDKCATQCTVSNKFNYKPETTYEFTYETDVRTTIKGASEDHAGVHMVSRVFLDFVSKCEMVMRLSDVKLTEYDPTTSSMKPVTSTDIALLESNPLTVSFQDGKIEDLCLASMESDKTLNIKRGILSMIQNNMDDITSAQTVKESDIAGNCETQYTSEDKGWSSKLIKKSKNLLGCTGRQNANTAIQGVPYSSDSKVQSMPLLKSSQECEQEIAKDSGRLKVATCHERHTFVPFSRQESGATTHTTQTLTFVKESKSRTKSATVQTRATLQFQQSSTSSFSGIQDLENQLMTICSQTVNGVTMETPKLFTSVVLTMRSLTATDMGALYKRIKNQSVCPENNARVLKFFLDAVPMTGTSEGIQFMTQLITTSVVTGVEADMWMTTLAFIQNPNLEMLNIVKDLLKMDTLQERAMLSVSALVHSVCRTNQNCENFIEVKKIISLLENKIATSCKIEGDMRTSLLAIRAIGNTGFGTSAIATLEKCFRRPENPIEIRISAVEAFRRIPCSADKRALFEVLMNTEEDSEIRIAAYKTIMECASDDSIKQIKKILVKEPVNQVGSYIWSHLSNLMETSDPHKQTIRSILEDETLKAEFDMEKRKYSRNYEGSIFLEKINTGATVESDIIWSSKSFIPRSGMFNLTVDLFGNAVNLFEIGGRIEGLEYFLESYFGPNGYFSETNVKAASTETAVDTIKADKMKIDRIDKRLGVSMDDLRGSLYLRVFGNELRYINFNGLDSLMSQNNINFLDVLMKLANENDYEYSHSTILMDSTIVIPTSSGFPLSLTVNGTATVDLKASGKVDIMKLASSPRSLDIHGLIKPSAAIAISTVMGVEALSTRVGVKMLSTLHTRTSIQGSISLSEGSILRAQFDMPEDKMDIISINSEFYTIHHDAERAQKMVTDNRQRLISCSGSKLAQITGLEICSELEYPNASLTDAAPYFPFTGPVTAAVTLFKRDLKMTGYKLEAKNLHTDSENTLRFEFSTPNSKIDRSIGVDLSLNKQKGTVDASLQSPWKKGFFKGSVINSRSEKTISGKMNWDESLLFDISGSLKSESTANGILYTPAVSINVAKLTSVSVKGSVEYAPWKLLNTSLSVTGLTTSPIFIKSAFSNKQDMSVAQASLTTGPKRTYSLASSLQKTISKKKVILKPQLSIRSPTNELIAFGGQYDNVFGKMTQLNLVLDKVFIKPVALKSKFETKSFKRGRALNVLTLEFESEPASLKIKSKVDNRNWKTIAADADLTYVIKGIARDNIKLTSKMINWSTNTLTKARLAMSMESKKYQDYSFKLLSNINHNKRTSAFDTTVSYGNIKDANKQINLEAQLDRKIKSWTEASLSLNGKLEIGTGIRMVAKLDHAHEPKSLDSALLLKYNKESIDSTLKIKDASSANLNIFGSWDLNVLGKKINFLHMTNETSPSQFASSTNMKVGKSVNRIDANWIRPSDSTFKITSEVELSMLSMASPVKLGAEYKLGPEQYILGGTAEQGKEKYSAMLSSQVDPGKSVQGSLDVGYPDRHIVGNYEVSVKNGRYSSRSDLRWNADVDDSQRLSIKSSGQVQGLNDYDGSVNIQLPSRTVDLNVNQTFASNRYISHVEATLDNTYKVSLDTVLSKKDDKVSGSFKFTSPIKGFEYINLDTKYTNTRDTWTSQVDLERKKNEAMSITFTLKKPFGLTTINASFVGKAPSMGVKSFEGSLLHSTNKGIKTVINYSYNKQFMNADLIFNNIRSEKGIDMNGQINLKTSLRDLNKVSLTLQHQRDGTRMNTNAMADLNNKLYGVKSSMTYTITPKISTTGSINVTLPSNDFSAVWNHMMTPNEIQSSARVSVNGKFISIKTNGVQNLALSAGTIRGSLEINASFKKLDNLIVQINHVHAPGNVDSSLKALSNNMAVLNVEGKYLRSNDRITLLFKALNPRYDSDIVMNLNADYSGKTKTGKAEIVLTPTQKISLDGSLKDNEVSLTLNVPNTSPISLKGVRTLIQNGNTFDITGTYSDGQTIRISSVISNTEVNVKLSSPFTPMISAQAVYRNQDNKLYASASFDATPIVGQWSGVATLDSTNGLSANIMINTPLRQVPSVKMTFSSSMEDTGRRSSLSIEYLPGQNVQLTSVYDILNPNDMSFALQIITPFENFAFISTELKHVGDYSRFGSSAKIEYPRGKTMSVETRFTRVGQVSGTVIISTPFSNDISATISHVGDRADFQCNLELTYTSTLRASIKHKGTIKDFASNAKLQIDNENYIGTVTFAFEPTITASLAAETPSSSYKMSTKFNGKPTNFNNIIEVSVPRTGVFSSDVSFNIESKTDISVSIKTPLKRFGDIKGKLSQGSASGIFTSRIELQNNLDVLAATLKLSTNPSFIIEATAQTPFDGYKQGRIEISHEGSLKSFKLHGEFQLNKDTSQIDLNADISQRSKIDLTIRSPYTRPIKGSFTHFEVKPLNYKSSAAMSMGKEAITASINFNAITGLKYDAAITTPFKEYKNLKATFSHSGDIRNFKTSGEASVNRQEVKFGITLDTKNDTIATVVVSTPWVDSKDLALTFRHSGSLQSFVTILQAKQNRKTLDGEVSFNNGEIVTGSASLKSTFKDIDNYVASFRHTGTISKFNCEAKIETPSGPSSLMGTFDSMKGISGTVNIKSPATKDAEIRISHSNVDGACNSNVFVSYDGQVKYSIQSEMVSKQSLRGDLTVKTPFNGFELTSISLLHGRDANGFRTSGSLVFMGKSTGADVEVILLPEISANIKTTTPWTENFETSLTVQGSLRKFDSSYEIVYGKISQLRIELDLNIYDTYAGDLNIMSPFIENIKARFNHQGDRPAFTTNVEITYAGKEATSSLRFNSVTGIDTSFRLTSPWTKDVEVTFNHQGERSRFTTKARLAYADQDIRSTLYFKSVPSIDTSFTLTSPWTKDIKATFSYQGNQSAFSTNAQIVYAGQEATSSIRFNSVPGIDCSFRLNSPWTKDVQTTLTHQSERSGFTTNSRLAYAGREVRSTLNVKLLPAISTSFALTSPWTKAVNLTFAHSGPFENSQTSGVVMYGQQALYTIDSKIKHQTSIDIDVKMTSAIKGFQTFVSKITLEGVLTDFKTHAELRLEESAFIGDLEANPSQGRLSIMSPFTKDIVGSYNIRGQKLTNNNARASLTYGQLNLIHITTELKLPSNAQLSVQLPVSGFETSSVKYTKAGDFGGKVEILFSKSTHEITIYTNTNDKISAYGSINSPFVPPMSLSVNLDITNNNLKSQVTLLYKAIENNLGLELRLRPDFYCKIEIRSPLVEPLELSVEYSGKITNFRSSAAFSKGDNANKITVNMDLETSMKGSITIDAPLVIMRESNPITASFELPSLYNGNVVLRSASDTIIDGTFSYKIQPLEVSLSLENPFKDINVLIQHEGTLATFKCKGILRIDDDEIINADAQFQMLPLLSSLTLKTPITDASLVFSFDGSSSKFISQASITIDGADHTASLQLDFETTQSLSFSLRSVAFSPIEIILKNTARFPEIQTNILFKKGEKEIIGADVKYTQTPLQGSISIRSPFKGFESVSGVITHKGGLLNFENHAEVTVSGKKTQADMSFNFGSKLEGKLSASGPLFPTISTGVEFEGTSDKFQVAIEYAVDSNVYSIDASVDLRNGLDSFATLKTPVEGYKTVTVKTTHAGVFPNTNTFAQIKTERRNIFTASSELSTTNGMSVKLSAQSVAFPILQVTITHTGNFAKFGSNAEFRFNGQPTSINVAFDKIMPSGSFAFSSPNMNPISGMFAVTPIRNGNAAHIEGTLSGQTLSGDMSYYLGTDLGGSVSIKTPFQGYEQILGKANLRKNAKLFNGFLEATMGRTTASVQGNLNMERGIDSSINLQLPQGKSSAQFTSIGSFPNNENKLVVDIFGQMYSVATDIKYMNDISAKVIATSPIPGYEAIEGSFALKGTLENMVFNGKLKYMTDKQIVVSFENIKTARNLETKAKLQSPFSEDMSFEAKWESNLPSFKTSANARVFGSYFSAEGELNIDDAIIAAITVTTPQEFIGDVSVNFEHSGTRSRFSTKSQIQYGQGKKIEGIVDYANYDLRRLSGSFDLTTPFPGFESTRASMRHTSVTNGYESNAQVSMFGKDLTATLETSSTPISASLKITTPFNGFETLGGDVKLVLGNGEMSTQANIAYMNGKTISVTSAYNINSAPRTVSIVIKTPFVGYETTELKLSQNGGLLDFQTTTSITSSYLPTATAQASLKYATWYNMDASASFTSKISNFENLRLTVKTGSGRGKNNGRAELSWTPSKNIVVEGRSTENGFATIFTGTVRTPFTILKQGNFNSKIDKRGRVFSNTIGIQYNGNTITDVDFSIDEYDLKSVSVLMRAPVKFTTALRGSTKGKYQGTIEFAQDIISKSDNRKLTGTFDPATNKVSAEYRCANNTINLDGSIRTSYLTINGMTYGYDVTSNYAKVRLPSRSLMLTGSSNKGVTEGSFMWDADKDDTKKIAFRSQIRQLSDFLKADVSLMLPSLSKDLQIGSEMILNRGRIWFDGKTELTYSQDSRKRFIITSKIEDISSAKSKNYSLSFGISHPYTSVNVDVISHFGKSDDKITGAFDLKYLTARQETKQFTFSGSVDNVKREVNLIIDTPMKKIGINGNAQTSSPYRLSLTNQYDNKRPLNTVVSFDLEKRSVDFQMNYDLENPTSELHVSAKYVNSSAVAAEVYHVVNRQKITDGLVALRLNTSHLLHSRIQWRPEVLVDLKTFSARKTDAYIRQLRNFADVAGEGMRTEIREKAERFGRSINEEIEPIAAAAAVMYERNEYRTRDIVDAIVESTKKTMRKIRDASQVTDEYMIELSAELEKKLSESVEMSKKQIQSAILRLQTTSAYSVKPMADLYNSHTARLYNLTAPHVKSVYDRYNTYVDYMSKIDLTPKIEFTNLFNSAIYSIHDRLSSNMVYQQSRNAYKYWEVRENSEAVASAIFDWIKEEVDRELSDIKAILVNLRNTTIVTVYDPEHGEIQAEVRLPFALKSLDEVPTYVFDTSKIQKYIPTMPTISIPNKWLPPYEAMAKIVGNRITTFDGFEYDLTRSCSFMLAKDYADGNFTVVLHNKEGTKTLAILADGRSIELFSSGQVKVDNKPVTTPAIFKNITITSLEGRVTIDVAGHIKVDYIKDMDYYTIVMNGFYFGKTNGLLGSYDNEPNNDMMTSFGKPINDVDRFARTWDVGSGKC